MDPLEGIPLEVLLALQEAAADPSELGRARATKRAEEAGFHIRWVPQLVRVEAAAGPPRFDPEPIPMEEAPAGVEALTLRFGG